MKETKLIEVIQTLSSKEMGAFVDFVKSPYFNKNSKLNILASVISSNFPSFSEQNISKQKVFKKLYPEEKNYRDEMMRKIIHSLFELLKKYMALSEIESSTYHSNNFLLQALKKRKLEDLSEKILQKMMDDFHKQTVENRNSNLIAYNLYEEKREAFNKKLITAELTEVFRQQFIYLDIFYFTSKLWQYIKLLMLNKSFNVDVDIETLNYYLDYIKKHELLFKKSILLKIYYHILLFYLDKSEPQVSVASLLNLIKAESGRFIQSELRGILFALAQYKIQKPFPDKIQYDIQNQEAMAIYRYMDTLSILLNDDQTIQPGLFSNICSLAVKTLELGWAEKFINKYSHHLPAEQRQNMLLYVNGMLLNGMKNYKKSYAQLCQLKYDSSNMYINTKLLQLINCFELNLLEEFYNTISSFNLYVNRNSKQFTKTQIDFVESFFHYSKSIFEHKTGIKRFNSKESDIEMLRKNIERNIKNPGTQEWLLNKVNEIKV